MPTYHAKHAAHFGFRLSFRQSLSLIASLLLLSGCEPEGKKTIESFNDIPAFLKQHKIPAVSVAVIEDFKIKKVLTIGTRDAASNLEANDKTLFQLGSVSQSLTAVAMVKELQNQNIQLDTDINTLLKSWRLTEDRYESKHRISPEMLLSHTAGTNITVYKGYPHGSKLPTIRQILNGQTPNGDPSVILNGTPKIYNYSAGGYSVIQQALMDLRGTSFASAIDQSILKPLGMTSTSYDLPLPQHHLRRASAGHNKLGTPLKERHFDYPELAAAGGWSTAEDLARFIIEIQNALQGRSAIGLTQESTEELLTPVAYQNALGFDIEKHGKHNYFTSGGANHGFQTLIKGHMSAGMGVAIMTNSDNGFHVITQLAQFIAEEEAWPGY
jgi:CubicO group peptidase (beta-lactamase class C family)